MTTHGKFYTHVCGSSQIASHYAGTDNINQSPSYVDCVLNGLASRRCRHSLMNA